MSSEKSDYLNDETDKVGSDSGSSGTYSFCAFYIRFDESIVSGSVLGSDILGPTRVESKGDIFRLTFLYQQESSLKVVDCLNCFGAQIPYFLSKFEN